MTGGHSKAATHAKAYKHIESLYGRLDILVDNAAIWKESASSSNFDMGKTSSSTLPMKILRETFETNFLWHGRADPEVASVHSLITCGPDRQCHEASWAR